jgi:dipeptidase
MCYMIAAGKKATVDGSVLVARNCDSNSTEAQRIISVPRRTYPNGSRIGIPDSNGFRIPQVPETYAYTCTLRTKPGDELPMVSGGVNEFQVCAGASTGGWVKKEVEALTPWPETAIGDYLMTLVLERCKTAREAVQFLGRMTEEYGARTDNYIVSDPQEAWLFEQYQGYHWAAARVPDDCFMVMGNSFRLAEINPDDPTHTLCDQDLISFAEKNGLWNRKKDGPFHASLVYGDAQRNRPRANLEQPYYTQHRVWRGMQLLAPSLSLDPYEPSKIYPLFVKPDQLLTPQDLFGVLKDTYENTPLDEYREMGSFRPIVDIDSGHYRYAPAWGRSRIIGCPQTIASWVVQCRDFLPNAIGGVIWAGLAATAACAHIPFYACTTRTPRAYQLGESGPGSRYMKESAYWKYETISNLMNLFYQVAADVVRPEWEAMETLFFALQPQIEQTALSLLKQDPKLSAEFLTGYSNGLALQALEKADEIIETLYTRYALVNNPQTSRAYEDPKTWRKDATVY